MTSGQLATWYARCSSSDTAQRVAQLGTNAMRLFPLLIAAWLCGCNKSHDSHATAPGPAAGMGDNAAAISSDVAGTGGSGSSAGAAAAVEDGRRATAGADGGAAGTGGCAASCAPPPDQHRASAVDCNPTIFPAECATDADCKPSESARGLVSGRCKPMNGRLGCRYDECLADGECSDGRTCKCAQSSRELGTNKCLPGNCRVDGDCGAPGYCSPTVDDCGIPVTGYYCHTRYDQCTSDADCFEADSTSGPRYCMYSLSAALWRCNYTSRCTRD